MIKTNWNPKILTFENKTKRAEIARLKKEKIENLNRFTTIKKIAQHYVNNIEIRHIDVQIKTLEFIPIKEEKGVARMIINMDILKDIVFKDEKNYNIKRVGKIEPYYTLIGIAYMEKYGMTIQYLYNGFISSKNMLLDKIKESYHKLDDTYDLSNIKIEYMQVDQYIYKEKLY